MLAYHALLCVSVCFIVYTKMLAYDKYCCICLAKVLFQPAWKGMYQAVTGAIFIHVHKFCNVITPEMMKSVHNCNPVLAPLCQGTLVNCARNCLIKALLLPILFTGCVKGYFRRTENYWNSSLLKMLLLSCKPDNGIPLPTARTPEGPAAILQRSSLIALCRTSLLLSVLH
jgi:hypothetical protein